MALQPANPCLSKPPRAPRPPCIPLTAPRVRPGCSAPTRTAQVFLSPGARRGAEGSGLAEAQFAPPPVARSSACPQHCLRHSLVAPVWSPPHVACPRTRPTPVLGRPAAPRSVHRALSRPRAAPLSRPCRAQPGTPQHTPPCWPGSPRFQALAPPSVSHRHLSLYCARDERKCRRSETQGSVLARAPHRLALAPESPSPWRIGRASRLAPPRLPARPWPPAGIEHCTPATAGGPPRAAPRGAAPRRAGAPLAPAADPRIARPRAPPGAGALKLPPPRVQCLEHPLGPILTAGPLPRPEPLFSRAVRPHSRPCAHPARLPGPQSARRAPRCGPRRGRMGRAHDCPCASAPSADRAHAPRRPCPGTPAAALCVRARPRERAPPGPRPRGCKGPPLLAAGPPTL